MQNYGDNYVTPLLFHDFPLKKANSVILCQNTCIHNIYIYPFKTKDIFPNLISRKSPLQVRFLSALQLTIPWIPPAGDGVSNSTSPKTLTIQLRNGRDRETSVDGLGRFFFAFPIKKAVHIYEIGDIFPPPQNGEKDFQEPGGLEVRDICVSFFFDLKSLQMILRNPTPPPSMELKGFWKYL